MASPGADGNWSTTSWGPSPTVALAGAADRSPVFVSPDQAVTIQVEALSLLEAEAGADFSR